MEVIAGDDTGTRGQVLRVDRDAGQVVVEGVNRVYKHVRRSQKNPQGGRLSKEAPISCPTCCWSARRATRPTRTGAGYLDDGSKERFCKKCGAGIGQIGSAKARQAKNVTIAAGQRR